MIFRGIVRARKGDLLTWIYVDLFLEIRSRKPFSKIGSESVALALT